MKFNKDFKVKKFDKVDLSQSMPRRTAELLSCISREGGLKDAILVGGTALSIHLHHRLSEDLDFCSTFKNFLLNRDEINRLLDKLNKVGRSIEKITDIKAQQDFEIDGMDINDHQQTYIISGVKVDFFAPDSRKINKLVQSQPSVEFLPGVKVAEVGLLAKLKSNLVLNRLKSRDFFDLKSLIEKDIISFQDILYSMAELSNVRLSEEEMLSRLTPESFLESDEGFDDLIFHLSSEQGQQEIISFFKDQKEQYKIAEANDIVSFEP